MTFACAGGEEPEPEPEVTAGDSVTMAAEAFDASVFDTLSWESSEAAAERGGVVFSYSCARCHGMQGYGDGGFVSRGDTLKPPSFHQTEWRFADDPAGLREMIFTGGVGGMPHWGLEGLGYRDVDAVTSYILQGLRGAG
ncbi:MAG: c-type cytochrome [Synechococcaceae cyanobacterium]|nr:c-type cytochrome [Synechococcaceae cyanobacterium]